MSSRYDIRASFGYRSLFHITPLIIQARASRSVVRSRLVFRHAMRGGERGVSFPICRHDDNLLIDSVSHVFGIFLIVEGKYQRCLLYTLYYNEYHARDRIESVHPFELYDMGTERTGI